MKQQSLNSLITVLRICVVALVLSVLSLFLLSFTVSRRLGDDLWAQLGLSRSLGDESIRNSFTGGYLNYYNARNIRNIASADRLAVARDLLKYTKDYISGPDFKNDYATFRNSAKPVAPTLAPARTKADVQKEMVESAEKSIREMEAGMKSFEGDLKKSMQESLDAFKVTLKEYKDINNPVFDLYISGDSMNNVQAETTYKADLERWREDYPEDYRHLIRTRLQEFLEATANVDFQAAVKDQYGKKLFVNAAYERKPAQWKQAYRAGRAVTEYARTFAEQWLKELR